uniref:Uncharacterized protein n=1 Tax=Acrobeloides nanus TaxID=290746 RepID=A0A914DID8_9BILA
MTLRELVDNLNLSDDDFEEWLKIFFLSYFWAHKYGTVRDVVREVGVNKEAVAHHYVRFRNICRAYFRRHPIRLGGPGIHVFVDEHFMSVESRKVPATPSWSRFFAEGQSICSPTFSVIFSQHLLWLLINGEPIVKSALCSIALSCIGI